MPEDLTTSTPAVTEAPAPVDAAPASGTRAPNPFLEAIAGTEFAPKAIEDAPAAPPEPAKEPEAPKVPDAPKAPPETPASQRFAAAARLERELRQKERAVKEAEAKLQAREAELSPWSSARERAAKDPVAALEALGLTYEQLTEAILSGAPVKVDPREETLRAAKDAATAEVRRLQAEHDKASQAEQLRQYETLAQTMREKTLPAIAAAEGEKYELAHAAGAASSAWEVIEGTFTAEKGRLLSEREALEQVETQIQAGLSDLLTKSKKAREIASKILAGSSAQTQATPGRQSQQVTAPTLTNRAAAEVSAIRRERPETDEERIARAAALLKW
jgi:hypothetical protein